MKHLKFLLLLLLAGLAAQTMNAHDFVVNGIYYNKNGSEAIVTYKGTRSDQYSNEYTGSVNIPSTVNYNGETYSVTTIGIYAFSGCSGLTSVTIPNSVTTIGECAFYGCTGLTSVTIPNSVTEIGRSAFFDCSGLTSVTIPNSVTTIGGSAFYNTSWFNNQPDGLVYAGMVAYEYKGTMPSGTSIVLKDGCTGIAGSAFSGCSGLTSVTIPNSVTTIGDCAFYGCSGLTSVTIPNSVTEIGDQAFRGCSGLTSVTIPNSVTTIGGSAFSYCTGLTSVTIPNSVTTIGDGAFYNTSWFNNQPDGLVYAGMVAYKYKGTMPSGTSIVLKDGCTGIAGYAFNGCFGLTSVTIPNSVTTIGDDAFQRCFGLTSVTIPNSVTTIGKSAFLDCIGLTSVTIPNSVTTIGDDTFAYCKGLTSVTIPNSVTTIGGYAFKGCTGLTSVTIPNSVTTIGDGAFYECTGLTSVTIGNSVTTIDEYAFKGCTGLTSMTIPNSVTTIGSYAFRDCTGLTSVTIGNSVTTIDEYAFKGCTCLTEITIPNSVTTIGIYAFWGCSGLTDVTIPNSVTTIGNHAFYYCSGLKKIHSNIVNPNNVTLGNNVFEGVNKSTCTLIVPVASYDLYKNASQWKDFLNIVRDVLVTSITISKPQLSLCYGHTYTLSATTYPSNAFSVVDWSSSNPNVATVDQSGLVTAKKLGTATITATATDGSSVSASCIVNVTGIENITFNKSETSIYVGGTETLTATITPSDVINKTLTWTSSNTNVATVDQNGKVTAKKLGTATITATATDGSGVSASCIVNVTGIENITFNKSETSIYVGGTETLTATITPSDVINKTLTWTSSNTTVATVDQNGLVTANKLGTATITATATDGSGVSTSCVVTVTGAESVTLNKEEVSMYIGDTETLTATVYPDGLINKTLSWSSSKTSVATVDQNGLVIARAPGTATIRATATDGSGVSDSCVVNVVPEYTMSVDTVVHIRGTERVARTVDINLDNREAISGLQFDITLPNYVELATANGYPDMWLDDARKARNHSVDINLIGTKKYRVVVSSPTNKTFKGNEGAILHFNVLVDRFPSIGNATINLSNIVLAEADETQHTIGSVTSDVRFVYLVGDANADTRVDIADYVLTANKIMVRPVSNFWSDAANANYNDNTLNVTDLVAITNIALEMRGKEIRPAIDGFQFAPAVALPGIEIPLTARVVEMNADRTIVAIAIDNNEAIAAMQLDLDLPDGVMLESASVTDRSHMLSATCGTSPEGLPRVMLSSFGINDINAGCGDVLYLTLRGKARQGELMSLTNAVMSERNLIEHGASGNLTLDLNDYTGVSTVVYDHVNIYGENGSIIIESPVEGTAQLVRINGISREVKVEPGRNVYPVTVTRGDIIIASFKGTTRKIQF